MEISAERVGERSFLVGKKYLIIFQFCVCFENSVGPPTSGNMN